MTSEIAYRLAVESDIERTYAVMLEANDELNRRLGRTILIEETSPAARALAVRRSALRYDSDRFWVADSGGKVVGFGLATVRARLWYLAALHVIPTFQSSGVGRELLRRCLTGEEPGSTRLTITEAAQPVSNALYMRFGMVPQMPILHFEGPSWARSRTEPGLDASPIDTGDGAAADLAAIDNSIFGTIRPEDHRCWLGMPGMRGFRLHDGAVSVGYLYLDDQGAIGPVATSQGAHLMPAIETGIHLAFDRGIGRVHARVPGVARRVVSNLLDRGFHIGPSIHLLLTSTDMRSLDRYLGSGGDALF
jgi:GNAT superfamily N-acetyltransferase